MKILVVCQHYFPEPFRLPDICETLVRRGHTVTVVTGTPNYPEGEIYDGYAKGARTDEVINGVRVHRCPLIPRKTGTLYRVLNYYSFVLSSEWYLRRCKEDFDVVFVNQLSPVMMAQAGLSWAKRHGKKCVLYCLDQWPESLLAGGIRKDSIVYQIFLKVSQNIYRRADDLLVSSRGFVNYFRQVLKLKDTDLITFADIPAGVSYAVEEDAKHLVGEDGFDVNSSPDTDYTVAYENETGTIAAASTAQASVTNEKKTTVETGILLDSAPYVLMFAVAAAGLSMNAGRKRRKA